MIELTTNPAARRAFNRAHSARAEAVRAVWAWLFSAQASR